MARIDKIWPELITRDEIFDVKKAHENFDVKRAHCNELCKTEIEHYIITVMS